MNIRRHPDSETLYVEEVDVGEAKPRNIVSGLVEHVPIEEVFLHNLLLIILFTFCICFALFRTYRVYAY